MGKLRRNGEIGQPCLSSLLEMNSGEVVICLHSAGGVSI